jgi:hypothetical protein
MVPPSVVYLKHDFWEIIKTLTTTVYIQTGILIVKYLHNLWSEPSLN